MNNKSYNFIETDSCKEYESRLFEDALKAAVKRFRDNYRRFDKRIATTRKKPSVSIVSGCVRVSLDFNGTHYTQGYKLVSGSEVAPMTIEW